MRVSVPSAIRDRAKAFLRDGEEISYAVPASVPMPALRMSSHVIIIVGRSAITVLSTGFLSRTKIKGVLATYGRNTRLGPVDMSLTPMITLGGRCYEIDEEYVAVINAADAELRAGDALPPDPHPGL